MGMSKEVSRFLRAPLFVFALLVSGCSAAGVIVKFSPESKLRDAYDLFDYQARPLPAERFIREALETYEKRNDEIGVAEAYRAYGLFFRSPSIEKWQKTYEKYGFEDKSATYATRFEKALGYFQKSEAIYKNHGRTDMLANLHYHMAAAYELLQKNSEACEHYRQGLIFIKQAQQEDPTKKYQMAKGYNSFDEFYGEQLKRLSCE